MNIQVYQSFLTVVQCRSFTQAAKYLNFTQPTISNHINALEEEYSVILFTRDGKNVYLTQAGKNFVPIAQQLMADYQKSQEVMRQFQKKNYSLKIGVSTQGICCSPVRTLPRVHPRLSWYSSRWRSITTASFGT